MKFESNNFVYNRVRGRVEVRMMDPISDALWNNVLRQLNLGIGWTIMPVNDPTMRKINR